MKLLLNIAIVFLTIVGNVSATEDLTTYTYYVEQSGVTTTNADETQVINLRRYAGNSMYFDFTADAIGNFDIDYDTDFFDVSRYGFAYSFHVSNTAAANWNTLDTTAEGLTIADYEGNTSTDDYLLLEQHEDSDSDAFDAEESTVYYLSVIRTDSTIQALIYSDSGRTSLSDTLSVTHTATKWRYYGPLCGRDTSGNEALEMRSGNVTINQLDDAGGCPPTCTGTGISIYGNNSIYGNITIY